MKAFKRLEAQLHSLLTWAVDGGILITGISEMCKVSGSQGGD
jgi:hypothetical protein